MNIPPRETAASTPSRRRLRATAFVAASAVVLAGGIVGGVAGPAGAADPLADGLVAQYLFDETSGAAVRNTADGSDADGDPLDAVVRNYADAQRAQAGTLQFTGGAKTSTGNWVELPDDILKTARSASISIEVRADASMLTTNHFLWNIGNDATQQYWFANVRGPRSAITTGSAAGERNGTGYAITSNRWYSLTAVIDADAGTLSFYTDGQRSGVVTTTLTPADISQSLNTIGRAPWPDALFKGSVGAFRVYDRALSDSEVVALSEADAVEQAPTLRAAAAAKLAAIDLGDTSAVTANLDLFTLREISWSSSNTAVLADDGTVTRPAPGQDDAVVTLTARAEVRGQEAEASRLFTIRVPALTAADTAADREALQIPAVARGNLALVPRGASGSPIAWSSSDPEVISDVAVGAAAPGVVTRPAWGEPAAEVVLTATIGEGAAALTRTFSVSVAAAPRPVADSRYMFAYFTADTLAGEKISLAASQGNSAMTWDVLNGGQPVLTSVEGTKGLRDPFVMRSAEGDRFFLIATDLSIGSGTSWDSALDNGSTYLEIWESTDLKNWSAQRHVPVSGPFASMTWAPEAYWDAVAGEYVVYWSSRVFLDGTRPYDKAGTPNYTYSKVMYATTRDFVTFSDAKVWQDAGDRIDSTMIEDDGVFYRFTKEVTGCVDIVQESSPAMRALSVPGAYEWNTDVSCISKTARNTTRTTEGPTIFRANPGDTSLPAGATEGFYLFVDDFTGAGYLPLFSASLADPQWRTVAGALPRSRHGSVLPVTLNQWESAKGLAPTLVATTTAFEGVEEGRTLNAGDTVTARVAAADDGAVAGSVQFRFGDVVVEEPVVARDGGYYADATVPDVVGPLSLTASYRGFDVVAASDAPALGVVVGAPEPVLEVSASVVSRCVAGRVAQVVKVVNGEDVPVSVSIVSPFGAKVSTIPVGSATVSFTTRVDAVAASVFTLTASAGSPVVSVVQSVPAPAATCR